MQRGTVNPKVILAFIVLMTMLGCLAQLGWQITLIIFLGPPLLWASIRIGVECWSIVTAFISWELDINDEFALAQGASVSREKKLQRRLELADHEAKWRLLLATARYGRLPALRALMVQEESYGEALLHGKCLEMWNEDRKWGNSFKWKLKGNVKAYYKVLSFGISAIECEIKRESEGLNEYSFQLFDRNHLLVWIIAKVFFPSRHLQVVDEQGNTHEGNQALAYMRSYLRDA